MSIGKELERVILGFEHDPLGHVLFSYPWGEVGGALAGQSGPRKWQRETLERVGRRMKAGGEASEVVREAVCSGHGPGKSALVCWLIRWALDTKAGTRVVVTANTEKQLQTKTWPELAKWHHLGVTKGWWVLTATALYSADVSAEMTWRADAIPWSENNTEAFAGLHNVGVRIVLLFDEASKIADKVWEVAEGALTDAGTEILWLVCGNGTRATGRFRECFRRFRSRWHCQNIDSRAVEGANTALFKQWVEDYGEDSDFVKVRVRGMFPNASLRSLISETDVAPAYGRHLRPDQYNWAPVILTCDPAWQGDDLLVIGKRQGLHFEILLSLPKNDNDVWVANRLAQYEDEFNADAVFVDFGYGTGIVSAGTTMGRSWQLVYFAATPTDPGYLNKRAEMWGSVRKWLKEGGALPGDGTKYGAAIRDDLLGPETVPRMDGKVQLESKQDMKNRQLPSPNYGDALAMSFASPVVGKHRALHDGIERSQNFALMDGGRGGDRVLTDFDPYT